VQGKYYIVEPSGLLIYIGIELHLDPACLIMHNSGGTNPKFRYLGEGDYAIGYHDLLHNAVKFNRPGGGITVMVDVLRMPERSFGYVPTPALVLPIEFTLPLAAYAEMGGHMASVVPLAEVRRSASGVLVARHQDPAVFAVADLQREPGRVGGLQLVGLALEDAGQHQVAVRRDMGAQQRREQLQRRGQDVGQHQRVAALRQPGRAGAQGHAVVARIALRGLHGCRVDVDGLDAVRPMQRSADGLAPPAGEAAPAREVCYTPHNKGRSGPIMQINCQ